MEICFIAFNVLQKDRKQLKIYLWNVVIVNRNTCSTDSLKYTMQEMYIKV